MFHVLALVLPQVDRVLEFGTQERDRVEHAQLEVAVLDERCGSDDFFGRNPEISTLATPPFGSGISK
jgi:hypothetical protein